MLKSYGVPAAEVDRYWPDLEPLILPALRLADWATPETIREDCRAERKQLWCVYSDAKPRRPEFRLVLITEHRRDDQRGYCILHVIGGHHLREAFPLFRTVEEWAEQNHMDVFHAYPRPGLARWLQRDFAFIPTDQFDPVSRCRLLTRAVKFHTDK